MMQDRVTVETIAKDLGYKPGYVRDVITKRPGKIIAMQQAD